MAVTKLTLTDCRSGHVRRAGAGRDRRPARLHRTSRSRSTVVYPLIGLTAALLAAVGVAWVVTRPASPRPTQPAARASASPSAAGPTAVSLADAGTTVALSWHRPAGDVVQYAVLAAPAGTAPVLQLMVRGDTFRAQVNGLDPHVDYCFQVAAVYSGALARSAQSCTHR